ncbi:MAG TPA: acetate--CoA ligase [Clostridia bacterium]|nr:acetate--CoA ligase [Clostridia bacterium]
MSGLGAVFKPHSVAVIGASKSPGKIGHAILKNIIESGYNGPVYPINPKEDEILGLRCYPSMRAVPGEVSLAVISVPPQAVLSVAEECGQVGVNCLVVITAGFKETGKEGLDLELKLKEIVKKYGMRMIGPNCLGIIDTHTPLNASFAKRSPLKGRIAFISQSGALGVAILDWSIQRGLGMSKFVSLGNKTDISETDLIEEIASDDETSVILFYLEDISDGRRFVEVARASSSKKPILIFKAGTTQAGAQAASSHTGALAGSDLAYDVAFKQAGVLRAKTIEELFDWASAFASQPIPSGKNVLVVTNSGGPGIITTDYVENVGLNMARFQKETVENLRKSLPPTANLYNPIDVIGDALPERYEIALKYGLEDPAVCSAIVLLTPTAVIDPDQTASVVIEAAKAHRDIPIVTSFMGGEAVEQARKTLSSAGIPTYPFPEPAVSALAGLTRYGQRRLKPSTISSPVYEDVDREAVKEIFREVKEDGRLVLLGPEAARVARSYNIPVAPSLLAKRPDEAAYMAEVLGFPVVLKIASPKIMHKTDVGGVKVNCKTPREVRDGFVEIMDNVHRLMPDATLYGVEVQKMMKKGVELIIGMTKDMQFGPLIAFGLGGIYVNLLKDVSFRLAYALDESEIEEMISETKAHMLLKGYRGEKPCDIKSIVDTIGRISALVLDFPEITDVDVNPVMAYPDGVAALDIKITIS